MLQKSRIQQIQGANDQEVLLEISGGGGLLVAAAEFMALVDDLRKATCIKDPKLLASRL
jgi:hypothetical protein